MQQIRSILAPPLLIALTCLSGVVLIGLQWQVPGWSLWALTLVLTLASSHPIRRHLPLVLGSLALLGITPINTDVSNAHMLQMALTLTLAVAIPYAVSKYLMREDLIQFPIHNKRRWHRSEFIYIFVTAAIAYLLLPFYLADTGSYQNWSVEPTTDGLIRLFIGTNGLGLWDELFFICTVLAVFRRYLPFVWANLAQAVLFTSFLYELGFRGWGPAAIFLFALSQGYIFRRTGSLLYIVTIHLTLDFILYLALIHAYYPHWLPIFIVS